jgi:hypothetical protein
VFFFEIIIYFGWSSNMAQWKFMQTLHTYVTRKSDDSRPIIAQHSSCTLRALMQASDDAFILRSNESTGGAQVEVLQMVTLHMPLRSRFPGRFDSAIDALERQTVNAPPAR